MGFMSRIRVLAHVEPLPPARPTSEILSDIDRQVGRLASVRERAAEVIKRLETNEQASRRE